MVEQQQDFTDVQFSASALWARRRWIYGGLILGALLAVAAIFAQPETNRSWAQVLVRPLGVDLTRGSINIDRAIDPVAERQLAGSFIVAERAATQLDASIDARTLRREIDIQGVDDAPILEFSWADGDAEVARSVAQTMAESYLDVRAELAADAVTDALGPLAERRDGLLADRIDILQERAGLSENDLVANLNAENMVTTQLSDVSDSIATLQALTSDPGVVISPAQLAQRSERPRTAPTLLAGALLGGMLGLLAALFNDRSLRQRDLGDDDLRTLGLSPLAHVPRTSRGADAFAGVHRRLVETLGDTQVLAFATADDRATATQIAPWYAWNLAESGTSVLLVSADFDNGSIASQFGVAKSPGMLEALVAGGDPVGVIHRVNNLHFVTAGHHSGDPTNVLQMVGLTQFLNEARKTYESIILHAPNIGGSEASLLAIWASDAVTLVVDDDRRQELQQASDLLQRTTSSVIGSIVLADTAR